MSVMSFTQAVYVGLGASSLVLLVGTILVRRGTPSVRRGEAQARNVWEMAFLAGGPGRVVDAALAGMCEDGRLAVGGPGVVTVRQATAQHAVESAVLDAVARTPGGALAAVRAEAMRSPRSRASATGWRPAD
ncbi:TIGR04222 domain-containing membrane protein [Streptomyces endophytica]|uniref:TIGR04222 domain-containing membrane protein n=1 Tax=Streptomyces endophytica TaxID=2991496 RepID=A0ABY6PIJ5_9ACTN|nr:TIGR04222 domain-containing membrane protein [Streptomyces endophytica]UZJ33718.1 TIGR04222 domain-containing membrane protein [Streptomyces endophytica]